MVLIYGTVHPPLRESDGTRGWLFEKDELDSLQSAYYGVPACMEHDVNDKVGIVFYLDLDPLGNLCVYIYVDENTPNGIRALLSIRSGETLGLSVRFISSQNPIHRGRDGSLWALEVSIVRQPQHPQSRILYYGDKHKLYLSHSGFEKIYHNMSTPEQTVLDNKTATTSQKWNETLEIANFIQSNGLDYESLKSIVASRADSTCKELNDARNNMPVFEKVCARLGNRNTVAEHYIKKNIDAFASTGRGDEGSLLLVNVACSLNGQLEAGAAKITELENEVNTHKEMLKQKDLKMAASGTQDLMSNASVRNNPAVDSREAIKQAALSVQQLYNTVAKPDTTVAMTELTAEERDEMVKRQRTAPKLPYTYVAHS